MSKRYIQVTYMDGVGEAWECDTITLNEQTVDTMEEAADIKTVVPLLHVRKLTVSTPPRLIRARQLDDSQQLWPAAEEATS